MESSGVGDIDGLAAVCADAALGVELPRPVSRREKAIPVSSRFRDGTPSPAGTRNTVPRNSRPTRDRAGCGSGGRPSACSRAYRATIEPRSPGVEGLVQDLVGRAEDRSLGSADRGPRCRPHHHRRDEISVRIPVVDRVSSGVRVLVLASFEAARVAPRECSGLRIVLACPEVQEARVGSESEKGCPHPRVLGLTASAPAASPNGRSRLRSPASPHATRERDASERPGGGTLAPPRSLRLSLAPPSSSASFSQRSALPSR